MKAIVGLGNPGARYDDTRHNVGWWVLDRLAHDWGFPVFSREGPSLVSEGWIGEERVALIKPTTFMNRSGASVARLLATEEDLDVERDLMVVVDDATLDAGRTRFRPRGSAGGHNGLRSIEGVLGHRNYGRMRVGVGIPPSGEDLVDWVLSPMSADDEDAVLEVVGTAPEALKVWLEEGVEATMDRFNR